MTKYDDRRDISDVLIVDAIAQVEDAAHAHAGHTHCTAWPTW